MESGATEIAPAEGGVEKATLTPTDPRSGLTSAEVAERRERYGRNAIETKKKNRWLALARFFWGPIPWMIEAAAILSAVVRHFDDLAIISTMLVVNAAVGFFEEKKADDAISALQKRLALRARVKRDGVFAEVDAADLVPGDLVLVRLGNIVPADLELAGEGAISVDQSALTGESLPVSKHADESAYSGSIVRNGEMTGQVTAIGAQTYFGRTAKLVESAQVRSHFQKAVLKIGNFLILVTLVLVAANLLVALFRRDPMIDALTFALILTVAAIPVALPAVLSVTMAAGASRLAAMKAIVSRLVSIEELAGMDILCSDKTGTLTKNQLRAAEPVPIQAESPREVLRMGALASRADDGDPIDAAVRGAFGDEAELATFETRRFVPFDPVHKRSEVEAVRDGETVTAVKGAPQVVSELSAVGPDVRRRIDAEVDRLAATGHRTLGVAKRDRDGPWIFLGLIPLFDPPREDAKATIARARDMGLEVRMVTGDNVAIARETARELGLPGDIIRAERAFGGGRTHADTDVVLSAAGFAEVFPEHKFELVRELQAHGHIVGMTGDGVNDAPALKQADAGIAVSGATDAARAAADLVLTAHGLSVITRAVEESRKIFERMTSYATFRIAETIRVLLFMSASIIVFGFYPVTAVMIVLLAILNDVPIMMIAYDNARVAPKPVRWDMRRVLTLASVLGLLGVVASFTLFWLARDYFLLPEDTVRSIVFLKLLVAGHLTIYVTRNDGQLWQRPLPSWKLVVATEATQIVGTLAAVYGWIVEPIGWVAALLVWAYAIVWLFVASQVKTAVLRLLDRGTKSQAEHLERVSAHLAEPPASPS